MLQLIVELSSFRFDFSGCGLSDGDFQHTTIASMTENAKAALNVFKEKTGIDISITAHSVSACVAAKLFEEDKNMFSKMVLIAPALNQKDLLRFWFTKKLFEKSARLENGYFSRLRIQNSLPIQHIAASFFIRIRKKFLIFTSHRTFQTVSKGYMKKKDRNLEINWSNFREYLNEEEFQKDCVREKRMTKANYILNEYFLTNKEIDYSTAFENIAQEQILHIHGNNDDKVPLESLNIHFDNTIIVTGGNHDMERPDMMEQWLDKCVEFLAD